MHYVRNGIQCSQKATYMSAVCTDFSKPLEIIDDGKTLDPSSLGENEVSVAIKACGINYADLLQCKGLYQEVNQPPFVPGMEISGEVMAVGSNVKTLKTSDRVFALLKSGGFSNHCIIPEMVLRKVPESISYEVAAGSVVNYATSRLALEKANLKMGETLFVTGAGGSTGLSAVDIGAQLGAKVIGSCGSLKKADVIRSKGASHIIDYNTEDVRSRLKELTDGKGPNVVFDTVGGDLFLTCLKSLAHEGRILTIGYTSGKIPSIPANLLLVKSCSVTGVYWGDYSRKNYPVFSKSIDDCVEAIAAGHNSPHIGDILPLSEINNAFKMIFKRQNIGKVVVKMD
ncbi:quinone oxidoreductase-like protein 2 homolog isoform X2 [Ylistrum balloti]|uniref:quinone oxidoreductase-like protein 2 homolog isoform X2 n=1 Tax=Ylistrum balloti TaxID=509963 RepID=UPI002905ADE9|nr:quinone oxidoreductase-like protein 2 homolog isoform X2 [Ylistrum balloti]